jgi:hypothetical protein
VGEAIDITLVVGAKKQFPDLKTRTLIERSSRTLLRRKPPSKETLQLNITIQHTTWYDTQNPKQKTRDKNLPHKFLTLPNPQHGTKKQHRFIARNTKSDNARAEFPSHKRNKTSHPCPLLRTSEVRYPTMRSNQLLTKIFKTYWKLSIIQQKRLGNKRILRVDI